MRRVRAVERQVHEKRPIVLVLDELDGRVGDDVADIALGFQPRAVMAERGAEIGAALVDRVGRVARLRQPAAVEHQRFLKTPVHRTHRVIIAQVPLAEDARAIAAGGEHFRQRRFVGMHERTAQEGVGHPGTVIVTSGHQASPRGRAHRHDVEIGQRNALRSQAVDVRRADKRIAGYAQFAETLVVGKDDDDVRFGGRVCRRGVRGGRSRRGPWSQQHSGDKGHKSASFRGAHGR